MFSATPDNAIMVITARGSFQGPNIVEVLINRPSDGDPQNVPFHLIVFCPG